MIGYQRYAPLAAVLIWLHGAAAAASGLDDGGSRFGDNAHYSDDAEFGGSEKRVEPERVKRPSPPNFGPYTKRVKDLCAAMSRDGRNAGFSTLLQPYMVKDEECPACYPFIRLFVTSCQVKKKTVKKTVKKAQPEVDEGAAEEGEGEEHAAEPTPIPALVIERDPSAVVADAAGALGTALAADPKRSAGARAAVGRLVKIVNTEPELSPGARDYYGTLASFMESAFVEDTGEPGEEAGKGRSPRLSEEELDAMFE